MPWEPGQSGNPTGRGKKEKPWREAIERAIKRQVEGDLQALDRAADKLVKLAIDGDMGAIKEMGDRLDGKPHQSMDVDATLTVPPLYQGIPDPPKDDLSSTGTDSK